MPSKIGQSSPKLTRLLIKNEELTSVDLVSVVVFVFQSEILEHIHIIIRVEYGKVYILNELLLNIHSSHFILHVISLDHLICHFYSEGLHGMAYTVLVVANIVFIEVAHFLFAHSAQWVCH